MNDFRIASRIALVLVTSLGVCQTVGAQESKNAKPIILDGGTIAMRHEDGPVAIHLTNNGRAVACEYGAVVNRMRNSQAKAILVVELESGRVINRMPYSESFTASRSACSPDGRYFVVCEKKSAKLFDLETGRLIKSWPWSNPNSFLVASPEGNAFAICDQRDVSVWNFATGEEIVKLPPHPTSVASVSFDQSGTFLLSSCRELTRKWDFQSESATNIPVTHSMRYMAIDPESSNFYGTFVGLMEGGAASYDMQLGRRGLFLREHQAMQIDFESQHLFTVKISGISGDKGPLAVQLRSLSNLDDVKYLPLAPRLRESLQRLNAVFVDDLRLSPDRQYLLIRLDYGRLSQIWRLDENLNDLLIASASHLEHTYVPEPPKKTAKTKEELFQERIDAIQRKVSDLVGRDKTDQAVQEIESLLSAGERRLQRAPRRHQRLLTNCGLAYETPLSLPEKALPLYEKALELSESGNRYDLRWKGLLERISWMQEKLGDRISAAKTLRRVVDHQLKNDRNVHGTTYARLGQLIFDPEVPDAASDGLKWFIKAWHQSTSDAGTLSNETRQIYDQLVTHAKQADIWEPIEDVLIEQVSQHVRYLGLNHPHTAKATLQLAQLYERLGKDTEALRTMDRSQRALKDHVARVLPLMSEQEQSDFLREQFQPAVNAALMMAVRLEQHPDAAKYSCEWILNSKGTATRVLAERTRMAASTKDPQVRAIAKDLAQVRNQISEIGLRSVTALERSSESSGSLVNPQSELDRLRRRESDLSWQLGSAGWTEMRLDPWVTLEQVRKNIADDTVLIELAVVGLRTKIRSANWDRAGRVSKIGIEPADPMVVAWVVPSTGQGSVRLSIVCRDWNQLATPINHFQTVLRGQLVGNGVASSPQYLLTEIASHLSQRLPSEVWNAKKLLISPDHQLWMVPWAALPDEEGRFLIHRHEFQYLLSGRDLLNQASLEPKSAPLVVANPDYGTVANQDAQVVPFAPLPGTAEEARGILPSLKVLATGDPEVYLGAEATESIVQSARRPKVAVFSTHGFAEHRDGQHPLATCGLAFCDANSAIKGSGEGVLTGLEVLAADYRGTELVVLSACQTGLGTANSGEGVTGLRYAFQLAGARNVAATLWSIPDRITAEMMTDFFRHYAAGETGGAALRHAQLSIIEKLEDAGYYAAPQLWAAFTIAGPPPKNDLDELNSEDVSSTQTASVVRTWRSADGKFSVRAKFVSADDQHVVLRREDGMLSKVPLIKLHSDDLDAIRKLRQTDSAR
ncbi:CHAT domain-containing protein [Rhodopirellula europaea]|uniref:Tetratricopeptide TPR_2 repeat protein n=1 Tax=Rhodopirellula europaea 6C TaxID=1263867 RepID=M2A6S4_9BACT|nr:CHAT domain-containing protein [Rhodopirellula europaea]EMB16636.1 Tetratricopeptide TPR_2 repeat protein [Rhodopirellula europaea 6C]